MQLNVWSSLYMSFELNPSGDDPISLVLICWHTCHVTNISFALCTHSARHSHNLLSILPQNSIAWVYFTIEVSLWKLDLIRLVDITKTKNCWTDYFQMLYTCHGLTILHPLMKAWHKRLIQAQACPRQSSKQSIIFIFDLWLAKWVECWLSGMLTNAL